MDYLTHEPEVGLERAGLPAKGAHEVKVQHVGRVEAQPVNVKFPYPEAHGLQQIVPHLGISNVQLCQQIVSAPVVIGKAVVILVVAPEVYIAVPADIAAAFTVFAYIAEGKEIAARMVEHAVENHAHARLMAALHKGFEIVVCAETTVELPVIGGVVAVTVRLEQRPDVKTRTAESAYMFDPGGQLVQPVYRLPVRVLLRCAAKPQRIDVIEYCFVIPCHCIVSNRSGTPSGKHGPGSFTVL